MSDTVLERVVFHEGKTFIIAGERKTDAFIIQEGLLSAYIMDNGTRVEIDQLGPGNIIAEANLLIDSEASMNFEAITDTTLVKVTRHDFEKKLKKMDSNMYNVVMHLVTKIMKQQRALMDQVIEAKRVDNKALEIVDHLLRDMAGKRKQQYEELLLPHFNVMVRALESMKTEERHIKQKEALAEKIAEIKSDKETTETNADTDDTPS